LPDIDIKRRIAEVLAIVQLTDYGRRFPDQLSGGQQQRVAIARALALKPRLVLLDEPLSNLDASLRAEIRDEIKRIQRTLGVTMIIVTHDQTEAMACADRLAVLNSGRLLQVGQPDELYHSPANEFVAALVGEANMLSGELAGEQDSRANFVTVRVGGILLKGRTPRNPPSAPPALVSCLIRPEKLKFRPGNEENSFRGQIIGHAFLGCFIDYTVGLDQGLELKVRVLNGGQDLPEQGQGQEVTVSCGVEDVLIFKR
jgi:ABC-type Fe3+/spermidine/putrescine transport system ATPase subunit